jgi:GNAT superfamily N-acetyltransferase
MEFTADIRRAWRDGGTKAVLTRGVRKIVSPVVKIGSLVFTECDLREPMPERSVIHGIVIREAMIDDLNLFENRELVLKRFNDGHRCFIGIEEATGKLANLRWINTTGFAYIPELERNWWFGPDGAYAYDLKTMPEFRRRGIDGYTRHYTYSYLRDTGYTRVYAYIHGDNFVSLKASRDFLKPICRVWYVRPRGHTPIMFRGRRPGAPELTAECIQLS